MTTASLPVKYRAIIPFAAQRHLQGVMQDVTDDFATPEEAAQAAWEHIRTLTSPEQHRRMCIQINSTAAGSAIHAYTHHYAELRHGQMRVYHLLSEQPAPVYAICDGNTVRIENLLLSATASEVAALLKGQVPAHTSAEIIELIEKSGNTIYDDEPQAYLPEEVLPALRNFLNRPEIRKVRTKDLNFNEPDMIRDLAQVDEDLQAALHFSNDPCTQEAAYLHLCSGARASQLDATFVGIATNHEEFGKQAMDGEEWPVPKWADTYFDYARYGQAQAERHLTYTLRNGQTAFFRK